MTIIEVQILNNLWGTFDSFFNLLGMIASVALGAPWILLALPPFAVFYYLLQRRYRYSSIEIQRSESLTRAPVYSLLSETLGTPPRFRPSNSSHSQP